eukprot:4526093-Prymnesium_polylepis.2
MSDFVAAANTRIPTLRGIKFTDSSLDDFQLTISQSFTAGVPWRVRLANLPTCYSDAISVARSNMGYM